MDLANIQPLNWRKQKKPPHKDVISVRSLAAFVLLSGLLCGVTVRVLATNFVSADALSRWGKVLGLTGAPVSRLENLGLTAPQIPIHLLVPFYYVPGLRSGAAPYLLSTLIGAALLALWYGQLGRRAYPRPIRMLYVLLIGLHPFFLWPATSGSRQMVSMFIYYAMCVLFVRVSEKPEAHWLILSGTAFVLAFLSDERFLYVFIVLIPMLPLLMDRKMLHDAPGTFYTVACTPVVLAFLSWAYLNWVFNHDAWHFLKSPESAFRGSWSMTQYIPWLHDYGGRWLAPLRWSIIGFGISFPVAWLLAFRNRERSTFLKVAAISIGLPVFGTMLATVNFVLSHPLDMLALIVPAVMVLIALSTPVRWYQHAAPLAMLAVGAAGGWLTFWWSPTGEMDHWLRAVIFQQQQADRFAPEKALGQWLDKNRQPTMIDDHAAYPALVVRGDAAGLFLPYSSKFQLSLMRRQVLTDQVAVPNPGTGEGAGDMINRGLPTLYTSGAAGFQLVYDYLGWRVYRRMPEEFPSVAKTPLQASLR